jgi:heat shock protein 1/8
MSAAQVIDEVPLPTAQTDATKLEQATTHKNKGNTAFAANRMLEAIDEFSAAIELDPTNHVLYSNRAAAYTAVGKKDPSYLSKAIDDANLCMRLAPDFAKGYTRAGAALFLLKRYAEAVKVYAAGLAKDPSSRVLLDGLQQAQKFLADHPLNNLQNEVGVSDDVIIGIDLGTTYSAVGVFQGNSVVMIPNERGSLTSPSYVCFSDTGKRFVGQAAKNMAARYPRNTVYDVKRFIGQRFEDEGVSTDIDRLTYKVVGSETGPNGRGAGKPMVQVDLGMHGKKLFAAEEISAMVLGYLKKTAETFLKKTVTKAVITVPAYFNDSQRSATKAAGLIAGLDVLRIINEPTAAALSYGLDKRHEDRASRVLIFDLGGGTFDVSILTIENGVTEVKATGGDTRLGGEDFDVAVTKFLIQEAVENQKMPDISNDPRAFRRLQTAVENAKRQLSAGSEAEIHVEALFTLDYKKKGEAHKATADFKYTLTRAKFESINTGYFNQCLETVKKVLKDAKLKTTEIDDIVLVGGSTRIPKLQSMLSEYFNNKELSRSLNPDEAVAYGAAIMGAILNGARSKATSNMLLMDVTPLSLGIETTGRVMSVIIPRNTSIPCVRTQTYTTEENYQTEIDVCVYEGERTRTDENNLLGKFTISGIERAKRGVPKIDVSFALDSNGMLDVTAKDQSTGAEARIAIERSGRSSEDEIKRMVEDAARYRSEDEEHAKRVEAFNDLEALIAEIRTIASESTDPKKTTTLETAADEAEKWASEHEENAKISEIKLRRTRLENTLGKLSR